jgi:hypothetical protein
MSPWVFPRRADARGQRQAIKSRKNSKKNSLKWVHHWPIGIIIYVALCPLPDSPEKAGFVPAPKTNTAFNRSFNVRLLAGCLCAILVDQPARLYRSLKIAINHMAILFSEKC